MLKRQLHLESSNEMTIPGKSLEAWPTTTTFSLACEPM